MMNYIVPFSIRHRWLLVLAAIGIVGLGLWNFTLLPIDAVPDITNKQVQINTAVTGLSPEEIEKRVTFPIEWAMQGIPGVEEVRSVSFYGVSQVSVVFRDDVDIYRARQLVSERLAEAKESLPQGVGTPFLGPIWTGLGEIYFWAVEAIGPKPDGSEYSLTDLRSIQDWIVRPQLRGVPGVTEINQIGGYERQYLVRPDPLRLISYHVSFQDIVEALEKNNSNVGGGYIEHRGEQLTVRSTAQIQTLEDIANIKLGTHDGVPFFVRNVAEVVLGNELRTGAGTVDGKEAVVGTAILLYGENSRVVAERVHEKLDRVQSSLPANVRVRTLYNRSYLVNATIETVEKNLAEGAVLVMVVLFLLLGNIRAALIAALAIPVSMLFAVTGMVQGGISGNLMSLGAIDFGIIVDGAVVMIENIMRTLGQQRHVLGRTLTRQERFAGIKQAAAEIARPTTFGVGIIMIVYQPILTLGGVEGKMFKPMAQVVLLALGGALLLTFTLVPALAALLFRNGISERESWVMRAAKRLYLPILRVAMRMRMLVAACAVAVVFLAGALAARMGTEFIPKLSEGALALQPSRIPSISLSASVRMQQQVEQALLKAFPDEIENIFARTGTSEVVTDVCGQEVSDTYIALKPREQWKKATTQNELAEAMEAVVRKLPGQNYEFSQPIELRMNELISGVRSDLAVKIYGEDLRLMTGYAELIADELRRVRGAEDVKIEQTSGLPMVSIEVDRSAVARYGINASDVQDVVAVALAGKEAGQVIVGDRRFKLVVRLADDLRSDVDGISRLPVPIHGAEEWERPTHGDLAFDESPAYVPLSSVARVTLTEGAKQIRREDGKRRVVVTANVRARDLGSFVSEAQEKVEQRLGRLPEGYWLGWGGQFENFIAAKKRLMVVVPLALGLIFVLLFATFGSVRRAILVFTGVPLALTGGVAALWLRGAHLSISAGVGFIALSGVAVLNGLVLVSFIAELMRQGIPCDEAVVQGCTTRLRPVLMTALVASFGFVPMALAQGMGAEVQRPLATVVVGGIVSSTILTLIVLPAIYRWFERSDEE